MFGLLGWLTYVSVCDDVLFKQTSFSRSQSIDINDILWWWDRQTEKDNGGFMIEALGKKKSLKLNFGITYCIIKDLSHLRPGFWALVSVCVVWFQSISFLLPSFVNMCWLFFDSHWLTHLSRWVSILQWLF